MSPRVKLIHVGHGEWREPIARITECEHPREWLRFDGRFALPVSVYCCACGRPYLHPLHGLTDEQIARLREDARRLCEELGWNEPHAAIKELVNVQAAPRGEDVSPDKERESSSCSPQPRSPLL